MKKHSKHPEADTTEMPTLTGDEEPTAPAVGTELRGVREDMDKLLDELKSRDQRIDELARAYSALLNDQQDFRGRLEREKERVLESERAKIALHLLQVADELERALAASKDQKSPLALGVQMIHEGLGKALGQLGIERLSLVGTPYDPNLAEVVDLVPVQDEESDGKVVAELAPGYRTGSRVVRAARVTVARRVAKSDDERAPNGPTA